MTNLPIIQSLWIGNPLSNLEKLCIQSFLDHGHKFHLYTYADIGGIPKRCNGKRYQRNPTRKRDFTCTKGSVENFLDWFRWLDFLTERELTNV